MAHPDSGVYPGNVLNGRWKVGAWLADGNFSAVYEGRDRLTGDECAIKILSMTRRGPSALAEFRAEGELLELLSTCSNVITMLDRGSHPMTVTVGGSSFPVAVEYIVLERAAVDLAELLVRRHAIGWEERLGLFRDVAKGMHQMHLREVVNRDLKGENILVCEAASAAVAKVSDLGRSKDTREGPRFVPEDYTSGRGDLRFAPPELLWGLGNTDAETMRLADLYLIGSVLFEFATGQGLTGIALGNPHALMMRTVGMTRDERSADFAARVSDLQARYETAYALFDAEVPPAVRDIASRLLRQLSAVDPVKRWPSARRRRTPIGRWDLQWLLRRIDIMILTLRVRRERDVRRPWRSARR